MAERFPVNTPLSHTFNTPTRWKLASLLTLAVLSTPSLLHAQLVPAGTSTTTQPAVAPPFRPSSPASHTVSIPLTNSSPSTAPAAPAPGTPIMPGSGGNASGAPLMPTTPPTVTTPKPPATRPAGSQAARTSFNKQLRINIAWQVALDAANFSPGLIDGFFKRNGTMALTDYAHAKFPGLSPFDPKVFQSLNVDVDNAITTYTVTDDDNAQVGGPLPEDWNDKAALDRLRYETLAECMGEKFHCTQGLLHTLNKGVNFAALQVGQTIAVPNIRPFPLDNTLTVGHNAYDTGWLVVNLTEKTIRVYDKGGTEKALFHCSIAKDKAKLPTRDMKVQVIASPNPNYTFDPKVWPDVKDVTHVLTIPPGPRNPVGLSWVGLDLPGYGMHGTPKPELIGKTGSHGCFRLTNWDALKLAGLVQIGTPAKVVTAEPNMPVVAPSTEPAPAGIAP